MRGWVVALLAVVGIVLVVAVGVIAAVVSSEGTAIVDLDVGTCFELPDDAATSIDSVDTIDCREPHLAEVVALGSLNLDDAPYPDDEELFALVERACREAGVVESTDFGLLPIAPSLAMWNSFDGRYLCVAVPYGGEPVVGSLLAPDGG